MIVGTKFFCHVESQYSTGDITQHANMRYIYTANVADAIDCPKLWCSRNFTGLELQGNGHNQLQFCSYELDRSSWLPIYPILAPYYSLCALISFIYSRQISEELQF